MPVPPPSGHSDRQALDLALRLAIAGLVFWALLRLVAPFVELGLWAVVTASALYPLWRWLAGRIGPWPAAALVTLGALLVVLGPMALLATSAVRSAELLTARIHGGQLVLPPPPASLVHLPVVGPAVESNWELARTNFHELMTRYGPRLIGFGEAAARPALHFAEGMAIFLAAVALAGLLYVPGDRIGDELRRRAAGFLGERGGRFVDIASGTIRVVARGVLGVAAVQALIIGTGMMYGGVPAAGLLALAVLALAALQIGVMPITVPVVIWAWFTLDAGQAILLTAWLTVGTFIDLVLKPIMLGSSLGTPRLVIFAGVMMGAISYGPIGLFIGPVLLAVVWDVLRTGLDGPANLDAPAARPKGVTREPAEWNR